MAQCTFHPAVWIFTRSSRQQAVVLGELRQFTTEARAIGRIAAAYCPATQSVVDGVDNLDAACPPTEQVAQELVDRLRGVLSTQRLLDREPDLLV